MRSLPSLATCCLLCLCVRFVSAAETTPGGLYETFVDQYMSGKWDELEETLKSKTKELNALTPPQKLDITYIKQSLAESRPAWWKLTKTAKATINIRPVVWGRTLNLMFDPAGKGGVQTKTTNSRTEITVSWSAADMDNPAHAEHGFSKGELTNLSVFSTLGMAMMWSDIPISSLVGITKDQEALLFRAFDFTGNVTGVYLGSPRARQWGLWLYMHSYLEKYAKMQTINARKAVAAAFLIEVLSNPKKYPSIKLPDKLDAENAEEKLALALHQKIEKQAWTLAEDKSIRESIKALALANPAVLKQGGKVNLPAALSIHLDPDQDAPLRPKRDAWFKAQFDKLHPGGK